MNADTARRQDALKAWVLPLAIALLAIAAWLGGAPVDAALRYQRDSVLHGEVHRIFTAHFPHLGGWHLALNLLGLGLVWWLVGRNARWRQWLLIVFFSMLSVAGGLLLFAPAVAWYVGLSGLLHGLLVAGALLGPRREWLIVALVAGKLVWEQWIGPVSPAWLGGDTIIDAHLYGAIGGSLSALALRLKAGA